MTSPFPVDLSTNELAVSTRELSKWYGFQRALDNVSLQVPTGAVYLLVGPNGAGKSTMLKILIDLARPSRVTASVLGLDAQVQSTLGRAHVGYVPEQPAWGYGLMPARRLLDTHPPHFPRAARATRDPRAP